LAITDPDGDEVELNADVLGVDRRSDPALIIAPVPPLRLRNIGPQVVPASDRTVSCSWGIVTRLTPAYGEPELPAWLLGPTQ
jgi:hypothetical protein